MTYSQMNELLNGTRNAADKIRINALISEARAKMTRLVDDYTLAIAAAIEACGVKGVASEDGMQVSFDKLSMAIHYEKELLALCHEGDKDSYRKTVASYKDDLENLEHLRQARNKLVDAYLSLVKESIAQPSTPAIENSDAPASPQPRDT